MSFLVVGLAGTIAGGKGAAREILEKNYDSSSFSLSDAIRNEARKRGLETNRDNLIAIGNELRSKEGPDALAVRISKKVDLEKNKEVVVVDSIRAPGEINFLRSKYKDRCLILFIDAPVKMRYERAVARAREGEQKLPFKEFKRQDDEGLGKNQPAWGNNLTECRRIADFVIMNKETKEKLEKNVQEIVKRYLK